MTRTRRERGEVDLRGALTAVVRLRVAIVGFTTLSRATLRLLAVGRFTARLRTVAAGTGRSFGSLAFRFAVVRFLVVDSLTACLAGGVFPGDDGTFRPRTTAERGLLDRVAVFAGLAAGDFFGFMPQLPAAVGRRMLIGEANNNEMG